MPSACVAGEYAGVVVNEVDSPADRAARHRQRILAAELGDRGARGKSSCEARFAACTTGSWTLPRKLSVYPFTREAPLPAPSEATLRPTVPLVQPGRGRPPEVPPTAQGHLDAGG